MAGFRPGEYACLGSLTVNGFPLNCPAWDVVNLDVMWPGVGEVQRGENLALPRIAGRRSRPRRLDEAVHRLVIWVRGDVNQTGTPYTTAPAPGWEGLAVNLNTLRTNVFAPVETGTGTRPCSLVVPGVGTLAAACQFEGLTPQAEVEHWNEAVYAFDLVIPGGRFA